MVQIPARTVFTQRVAYFGISAPKGGKFHPKLNMATRLIANKYREGKVKRTLKRELKVLEIVKGEANIAVGFVCQLKLFFGIADRCYSRTPRSTLVMQNYSVITRSRPSVYGMAMFRGFAYNGMYYIGSVTASSIRFHLVP
jgi:hypothetical protein